jgi:hypothetical protein
MSPVIDLQRAIAEIGRIRIGQLVADPKSRTGTRPKKLDTFRLTSADKRPIERAAQLFGGTVEPWEAPAGPQWQVITETAVLDVIVPPSDMAFSQYLELWSGGGCLRRCDGATELLTEQPCLCDPAKRECDYHTRVSVMIRDLPGLGVWRLDTQGWYAARELAGAVEIIQLAAGRGILLPARLLVEQRSVKRLDARGKPQTLRFPVPRLDPGITPGELLAGQTNGVSLQLAAETRPLLTPVPQIEGPRPTIAEQSAPPAERPARRNAAPAIPASGRQRAARANATPEPTPARSSKNAGDEGYWRARTFADGAERGIDTDRMRELAATQLGVPLEGFSMSTLDEDEWERIHQLVMGFPPTTAQDAPADAERPSTPAEPGNGQDAAAQAGEDVIDGLFREADAPAQPAEPAPVTWEVFKDSLAASSIPRAAFDQAFARRFPGMPVDELPRLKPDELGRLLAEIREIHQQSAATTAA